MRFPVTREVMCARTKTTIVAGWKIPTRRKFDWTADRSVFSSSLHPPCCIFLHSGKFSSQVLLRLPMGTLLHSRVEAEDPILLLIGLIGLVSRLKLIFEIRCTYPSLPVDYSENRNRLRLSFFEQNGFLRIVCFFFLLPGFQGFLRSCNYEGNSTISSRRCVILSRSDIGRHNFIVSLYFSFSIGGTDTIVKSPIWYRYKEGFNNAVRKDVTLIDLM